VDRNLETIFFRSPSARLSFAKEHDARRLPYSQKSSESAIASKGRALLHAVVDRRYTNSARARKPLRTNPKRLRLYFVRTFPNCYLLVGPITGCAQALEIHKEARLNRCAICLPRDSEELVVRDPAIGRVLDYRADCITQWIIVRPRRDSDVTPAQQVIDVARARDDGSTIERLTVLAGQ